MRDPEVLAACGCNRPRPEGAGRGVRFEGRDFPGARPGADDTDGGRQARAGPPRGGLYPEFGHRGRARFVEPNKREADACAALHDEPGPAKVRFAPVGLEIRISRVHRAIPGELGEMGVQQDAKVRSRRFGDRLEGDRGLSGSVHASPPRRRVTRADRAQILGLSGDPAKADGGPRIYSRARSGYGARHDVLVRQTDYRQNDPLARGGGGARDLTRTADAPPGAGPALLSQGPVPRLLTP